MRQIILPIILRIILERSKKYFDKYDYKFVCMSHNTLRGAAGGAVLLAELLCAENYI